MKSLLKVLLLLGGIGLIAWFVWRAGPAEVVGVFRQLGWWLPVALLPFLLVYVLDTLGWRFAFGGTGEHPAFPLLLRVRWAGEAVNNVVPTGYVGGEAVKALLLTRRGTSGLAATSSVVVGKTLQVTAQVLFIALGAGLAFWLLPAASPTRTGMAWVAGLAALVVVGLFWIQSHGIFKFVQRLLAVLPFRVRGLESRQDQLRAVDERIRRFYQREPRFVAASTASYFLGWLGDALDLWIASHLLGFPLDFATAIAIESFITVAKALGIFVPGAIGVQESGVWLLFQLFGLGQPQAAAYALLRRGRELIYTAIGLALLYRETGTWSWLRSPTTH